MTALAPLQRPQAACQGLDVDPDWWTSSDPDDVVAAGAVCRRCPEQQPCLIWALKTRQRGGVFGGFWFGRKKRKAAS